MRLIVVPLLKANWAYFCHSTAKPTGRVAQWVVWSVTKWEDLGKQPPRSIKKRLHDAGTKVIDRVEHEETFLKSVPAVEDFSETKDRVPFYFPSILSLPEVQQRFKTHISKRQAHHKRYMMYSVAFLPVSGLFTIVPLIPNIPFFYNVFRLYSHYKAYKGAQHLSILSEQGRIQFISDKNLDCAIPNDNVTQSDVLVQIERKEPSTTRNRNGTSNSTLDEKSPFPAEADTPTPGSWLEKETIDEECVRQIVDIFRELFPVLEADLRKARFQVLEREKKNLGSDAEPPKGAYAGQ